MNPNIQWACPGCGVPITGLAARAGEPCYRCEAVALWAEVPDPVRAEFDELVRGGRRIQAIAALRDGVDPMLSIGMAQSVLSYRMESL